MILVTGATGHIGGAVMAQLMTKIDARQLAVLVRNRQKAASYEAAGVRICEGSYGDVDALKAAMVGIEKVLLVSGGNEPDALQQHCNVVDAAKEAGVKLMSYTSRDLRDPENTANNLMRRHFATEDYIKASGMQYALFRNILYMDVLPLYTGNGVFENGFALPAGKGKAAYALRSEMGEAMANILLADLEQSVTYKLTGSSTYSFADLAASLGKLAGHEVPYTELTMDEYEARAIAADKPLGLVKMLNCFLMDIENMQESNISPDLAHWLGRNPKTLDEGVKELYGHLLA